MERFDVVGLLVVPRHELGGIHVPQTADDANVFDGVAVGKERTLLGPNAHGDVAQRAAELDSSTRQVKKGTSSTSRLSSTCEPGARCGRQSRSGTASTARRNSGLILALMQCKSRANHEDGPRGYILLAHLQSPSPNCLLTSVLRQCPRPVSLLCELTDGLGLT